MKSAFYAERRINTMYIQNNVVHTQTKGCTFCLHIGYSAIYFGIGKQGYSGAYLAILTHDNIFKFSLRKPNYQTIKRKIKEGRNII